MGREFVPPSAGGTRDKEFAMKRMTLPIAALILALLPSLSFADGRFRGGFGFGRGFGGHGFFDRGFRHHSSFGLSFGFLFGGGPRYYDDCDYSYYRPVYRSYCPPPVYYYDPAPVYYYDAPVIYRPVRHYSYDDCGPYYYRPSGAGISFSYSRYRYR